MRKVDARDRQVGASLWVTDGGWPRDNAGRVVCAAELGVKMMRRLRVAEAAFCGLGSSVVVTLAQGYPSVGREARQFHERTVWSGAGVRGRAMSRQFYGYICIQRFSHNSP